MRGILSRLRAAAVVIGMSAGIAGCAGALDPIYDTASFLSEAEALARAERAEGEYPSPFGADARAAEAKPPTLSPAQSLAAARELRRAGKLSEAEIRAYERRLLLMSPY